ncbi:hypothetical protein BJY00DRAFT_20428 [Aspergillus carlsbadensis]|nr:hypothetical protein BJY00DRAFT_20428 [Aspergillus carlsbadensis]
MLACPNMRHASWMLRTLKGVVVSAWHEPWFILLFAPNGPKVRPQIAPRNLGSASELQKLIKLPASFTGGKLCLERIQESHGFGRGRISFSRISAIILLIRDSDSPESEHRGLSLLSSSIDQKPNKPEEGSASIEIKQRIACKEASAKVKGKTRCKPSKVHSDNRKR